MEVKVKVLMNAEAIAEAQKTNQKLENQRKEESLKVKGLRKEVEENVPVPEKEIVEMPMLIDAFDVDMVTIGSEGMIEILFKGKAFEVVKDDKTWNYLAKAISAKEQKQFPKSKSLIQRLLNI